MNRVYRLSHIASTKDHQGILPISPATVWRKVKEGTFPKPYKLGENTTVWDADQIDQWLQSQRGAA